MTLMNHLIAAAQLNTCLSQPSLRVFDCRHRLNDTAEGQRLYLQGHIPGATHVHLDSDLSAPMGFAADGHHLGRHPLPTEQQMLERFGCWGITPQTEVVVYDDLGGAMAARLWWLLRAVGHTRVRVLDGGWQTWAFPVETAAQPLAIAQTVYPGRLDAGLIASYSEIKRNAVATTHDLSLLDARSPDRFRGENEPLDPPGGHIPGAINTPYAQQLTSDGLFKSAAELQAIYAPILAEQKPIVCSCGSGVTACHLILGLALAGRTENVQLFPESFSGWIRTSP